MKTKLTYYLFLSMFFGILQSYSQTCTGFTTYTMGGWGTHCHGGNPGCYRDANFDAAFPDGVLIGSGGNTLALTSTEAVEYFLPSGTTPRALPAGALVDPGNTYRNVLAGQLVTLTLNVGFDAYDANFSSNTESFGNLIITMGPFEGMTVNDFLALANGIIGGTQTGYTFSQLNVAASAINENYDNGCAGHGFLDCNPCPNCERFDFTIASANVMCFGETDGTITITTSGGTAPYSYYLNNVLIQTTNDSSYTFTGLSAGDYIAAVNDDAGNSGSSDPTTSITQPGSALSSTSTTTDVTCLVNGGATITAAGGTTPYAILWSNGSTDFALTDLAAGTYTAVITDTNGCEINASVTIENPESLELETVINNVTCYEANDGSITITPTNGTEPYTILWTGGNTSFTRDNLAAGTYTAVITDASGCTSNVSATITQPTALASSNAITNAGCSGATGSVTVTATGGTGPYTILWSNESTDFTLTNLAAGTYTATITDANGCELATSATIENTGVLEVATTVENVDCFGDDSGSITVTATGGTEPYTILWSNGSTDLSLTDLVPGTYTAVVSDAGGCTATISETITAPLLALSSTSTRTDATCCTGNNGTATVTATGGTAPYTILWSTGATTFSIEALVGGTYTYTVTDANGCQASGSVLIRAVPVLASTFVSTPVSCAGNDATITVTASGGTMPYTILWANGSTTFTLTDLAGGTYEYTVTDANGCQTFGSVPIETIPVLESTYVTTVMTCAGNDASITVTATGGTSPYTILWNNGSTTFTITDLAAGDYSYVVTDANECETNGLVTITDIPVLAGTASFTNVACFAGATGSVTATATGGTPPYTILWSNGSTDFTVEDLVAGTYTAVITDANGCTSNVSATITQPAAALAYTNAITNVSCFAGTTGSVTVTATGGTSPYTILWTGGNTNFTRTGLAAGTYTAVVTDANGCTSNVSATITQPAAALAYTNAITNVSCFAGSTGSVTVTATGGTSPYTILWAGGATTFTRNNLVAGTYTAVVTDANGCTSNVSATITQPAAALAYTNAITNVSCFAGTTGSVTVTATGGTSPYTILWTGGATTFTRNNLVAGTYTAVVTDANGCTSNVSATITQPAAALAYTNAITNVSCFAGSTGSVTVTATGGTSPYTILWTGGSTTFTRNNLAAGTYTAVVTDANGCTSNVSATITQPAAALASTNAITNVSCFAGATGSVTVTATGGTSPYTILWAGGATTFIRNNLAAGTYTAVVTDARGCTSNVSATITQPAAALASTNAITNVSCFAGTTGSVTVTATGGTSPYTILWAGGSTTFTRTGLAAGTYTAVITDANGCTSNVSATITQPAAALASTNAITNVACFAGTTGSVTVTATGGTSPYTILWANGGATTFTRNNLVAGTYTAVVTDANGCTSNVSATITQPAAALASTNAITNVSCFAGTTGSVTVTATGGTSPYTILWAGGATTFTRNNLVAGTYTAVVTDANGCTSNVSATITQPAAALAYTNAITNVSCFAGSTGSVTVTATGGTSPYTILWTGGSTTFTRNNLVAGTYTAVITDARGCTSNVSATITQPAAALAYTNAITNVSCFAGTTGSVTVTATGGTSPYTILWTGGNTNFTRTGLAAGTYTAVVTDANGCTSNVSATITQPAAALAYTNAITNVSCFAGATGSVTVTATGGTSPYTILWTGGATTFTRNNLVAGTYTAVVTDANGCTSNVSATITQPAAALASTNAITNVSCFAGATGSVTVTATGGTSPYTILWAGGATTFTRNNLVAGTYTAVVTDANGCTSNVSATITQPAAALAYTNAITNVSCFAGATGSVTVTATGGTSPYTILWTGGATTFTRTGLAAGTYTAVVTDANGCTSNVSATITQPAAALASTNAITNVSCFAGATGSVTVTATGGTSPYTILWAGGSTTFTRTGLAAGTYTAVVTDANGCTSNVSATITQPAAALASTNAITNVSCFAGATGSVTVTATGGTSPYTILWTGGNTNFTRTGLAAGTYTAVVTDANGCTSNVSATITQPAAALASTNAITNVSCFAGATGSVTVTATGGTSPYTILWAGGSTTFTRNNLAAGTYTAVVTDARGCTSNVSATITQPAAALAYTNAITNVSCFAGATGSVTVTATGGTSPYTILWTGGNTSFTRTGLAAGTYTAVVTDANGCTSNVSATITQPAAALASTNAITNVSCFAGTTGSVTVTATGGTSPYTILWAGGSTTFTRNNLVAGTYTAVVTDANGCTSNVSATITQPAAALASTNAITNVSCFAGATGSVTVTATGGTSPYTILWAGGNTNFTRTGLAAGTYTAVITDANGCTSNVSATITQPAAALAYTNAITNVSCFAGTTGSVTVTATGGTSPYTILWANGGATTFTRTGLAAGTYTAVVTDANGCTSNVSATITQPAAALAYTNAITNVSCFAGTTGSVTVTATGGTSPYTILWTGGNTNFTRTGLAAGTYTAVVTDANGCTSNVSATITQPAAALAYTNSITNPTCTNSGSGSVTVTATGGTSPYTILWTGGATTFTRTGLTAGTYTAVITDARGCTANVSATVVAPVPVVATATHTDACFGESNGSVTATVTSGIAPYTILWSNGATTFTVDNLPAGTYTAVITAANGCTTSVSTTVSQPAAAMAVAMSQTPITSSGGFGTATATVTGGTSPYTYLWDSTPSQTTQTANLQVGWYTVVCTDAAGCTAVGNVTLLFGTCKATTVSKHSYETNCDGRNSACYLNDNFATSFPNGMLIGAGTRYLKFTTAQAVRNFLSSDSGPKVLNQGTLLNPSSSNYNNELAAQVLTTRLNIAFGRNADFSSNEVSLADLYVASGTFEGMKVSEVLTIANTLLGNGDSRYTLTEVNNALIAINGNYEADTDMGFLRCTGNSGGDGPTRRVETYKVYPNPIKDFATVEFILNYDTNISIELYNINGQLLNEVFTGTVISGRTYSVDFNGQGMKSGVYFLKLIGDSTVDTKSIVIGQQ
jgi:hypothetical protein